MINRGKYVPFRISPSRLVLPYASPHIDTNNENLYAFVPIYWRNFQNNL